MSTSRGPRRPRRRGVVERSHARPTGSASQLRRHQIQDTPKNQPWSGVKSIVEDLATGRDGSYVRWRWEWRRRAKDPLTTAPGVSHLRFDSVGRITTHTDLFDAAEGSYETLPVIGSMLRTIKRRL